MISAKAPLLDDLQRAPIDLVLVVDRSGSMASLMKLVIETIEFCISQLRDADGLCIIDYDDRISTVLPLTKMTTDGRVAAVRSAKQLSARGGTNLAGGLFEGMRVMTNRKGAIKNDVASVLLFTDGQANTGITDSASIVRIMKEGGWKDAQSSSIQSSFGGGGFGGFSCTPQQQGQNNLFNTPAKKVKKVSRKSSKSESGGGLFSMLGFGSGGTSPVSSSSASPPAYQHQQQLTPGPPSYEQQQQQQQIPVMRAPLVPVVAPKEIEIKEKANKMEAMDVDTAAEPDVTFTVNTFGFGASHNEDLLQAIAKAGKGLYFYIENKEVIADAFIDCVGGLLSVVAQDIKLTVQACEGVELLDVMTHYPKENVVVDGRPAIQVTMKDLQSEESRDMLCKLKLPKIEQPTDAQQLLQANIEYDNITVQPPVRSHCEITATVSRPGADAKFEMEVNALVDKQMNRIKVANALEEATRTADRGDLEGARQRLRNVMENVQGSSSWHTAEVQEMNERCTETLGFLANKSDYDHYGSSAGKSSMAHYQAQRFSGKSAPLYENTKRKAMKASFAMFKK